MGFNLRKPPQLSPKMGAYPYQLDAVRAIRSFEYAAIFHEQGLGKTKIAIDLILYWLEEDLVETVFVVTKKTLVQNWIEEIAAHSHITPRTLSVNRAKNSIVLNSPVLFYVLNYEVILSNLELMKSFLDTCRVGIILDESQKIKNPDSNLATCFHSIADKFERRIIMTGTPVANRPYDIWSQIKFLDNGKALGNSFSEFKSDFDLPPNATTKLEYGLGLSKVMGKIRQFSIRDTKRTAGLELPDKTICIHSVKLAKRQSEIYALYRDKMAYELQKDKGFVIDNAEDILKRLLRLVQCASNPILVDGEYNELPGKFTKMVELFNEIDLNSNKAIIWTGFVENVEWLCEKLGQYNPQKVHGYMSVDERNESIRKFKSDDSCRIFLATPGAAKEGLTLTVANHAIFFDRSFSLDDYLQAQDRIHRISQTQICYIHNLIAEDTIDEWVDMLLNAKFQAAQLTQGDITRENFDEAFQCDLSQELQQILSPKVGKDKVNEE